MVDQTLQHDGLISYKQNPDGTQSPYELNINYFDALSDPDGDEPLDLQIDRFMAAQAIMLSLRGVPGIYFHSLFGSRNWCEGVQATHHNRSINRQKLELNNLVEELADQTSLRSQVFNRFRCLLLLRASSAAFHPNGAQEILDIDRGIFGVLRTSPDGRQRMLCLQNVTSQPQAVSVHNTTRALAPYQTLWKPMPNAQ